LHQGQAVYATGEPLKKSRAAMILLHGRGATAQDILSLSGELAQPGFAYLAPQAAGNSWYPNRFIAPLEQNEPWLSSDVSVISDLLVMMVEAGIPSERIMLLGFSQGACLALEYAARNARRYGGLVGLSGGLIGPEILASSYTGSLKGTPAFLGCSDVDLHIPRARVDQTAEIMTSLGANVTERLYPNMDHTVNQDEIEFVREMMQTIQ
jgi:predicted esterase